MGPIHLKLTPDNVTETFRACLRAERPQSLAELEAIMALPTTVQGITLTVGFDPERLRAHYAQIDQLVDQLPETFKNGWSFLNLCMDKDGEQWTGMHCTCEELMLLGIASGRMSYCMPRDFWGAFPGGVPYVLIHPRKDPA